MLDEVDDVLDDKMDVVGFCTHEPAEGMSLGLSVLSNV